MKQLCFFPSADLGPDTDAAMLTHWTIKNFKSIGNQLTLPLSPLTILVGANSSGKSSIIQSLLLIKQTLQYATVDRPIALNGPLLKLGNFNDVKNALVDEDTFSIGWKINTRATGPQFGVFSQVTDSDHLMYRSEVSKIECLATFGVDRDQSSELSLLQPILATCDFRAESATDAETHEARITVVRSSSSKELPLDQSTKATSLAPPELNYSITVLDDETREALLEDYPEGTVAGAAIWHLFPIYIGVRFDATLRNATRIAEALCTLRIPYRLRQEHGNSSVPIGVIRILENWLDANREYFAKQEGLIDGLKSDPLTVSN